MRKLTNERGRKKIKKRIVKRKQMKNKSYLDRDCSGRGWRRGSLHVVLGINASDGTSRGEQFSASRDQHYKFIAISRQVGLKEQIKENNSRLVVKKINLSTSTYPL